jgi:hypothetical protein
MELILRDPQWFYVSWVDENIPKNTLDLRLSLLQKTKDGDICLYELDVDIQATSWYLLMPKNGAIYYALLSSGRGSDEVRWISNECEVTKVEEESVSIETQALHDLASEDPVGTSSA